MVNVKLDGVGALAIMAEDGIHCRCAERERIVLPEAIAI